MNKPIKQQLEDLRQEWQEKPHERKIIEMRAKLLRIALEKRAARLRS